MTNTWITLDEAQAFLRSNPTVVWIDLILFDMNGIARGKRLRRDDLLTVARDGIMIPSTVFVMDSRGNCIEETGRLWETGDPDVPFRIIEGTLHAIPTGERRLAQAVISVAEHDDLCPRGILAQQVKALEADGRTPVVAVELEFYLTKPRTNGAFNVETPDGLAQDTDYAMTLAFGELDAVAPFIDTIYEIADTQKLPVGAVMQETGPGQFEINLKHRADAVAAATEGLLLKRAVKAAAKEHGFEASFMAKPHHDWPGSGMHVHTSLIDRDGKNILAGDPLSPLGRNVIAGLQTSMADFMAVWAQSANAYRRYVPNSYVSLAAEWGLNNRNVALRIPRASGAATRIEHRVSGADANPFLVIASILAGARHGIAQNLEPGPMALGEKDNPNTPRLPIVWFNALERFATSSVVRDAFGPTFQHVYFKLKDTERAHFERIVTSLDHTWYAQVA
ncbi:glutamine synthetase [Hyphomicrobium methylovorum]|uniref:glutamine synthetase family protein n=1 Tax=Hyphomicrobium methylovorum TaxID=84 RepID=UPI0015E73DA5|nr:glutamine synthetase family protein [Hyphomicrobium methylovorum]MBA2127499.1 glutamine synthetase [Hyphomicrobium methylovorum]